MREAATIKFFRETRWAWVALALVGLSFLFW
jgi:hypothetical protein